MNVRLLPTAYCLLLLGCRQDMHDTPRYEPYEPSSFFEDGLSSRPIIPGTVARGHLNDDEHFYTGKTGGAHVTTFPYPVNRQMLNRGQQRFDIYCSTCHGRTGDGQGMIAVRGFRRPPSLHIDRLRAAPVGYFYDVISNGFGAMLDYASQIDPEDRWAIIAYIRALQLSQRAKVADVPIEDRPRLSEPRPSGSGPGR